MDDLSLEERRAMVAQFEKTGTEALGPMSSSISESWTTLKLPSGYDSPALIVRPKEKTSKSPLVVYFYGGGYTMGSPLQVTRPAREFAERFGAVVVCPSYRHVPEHPWVTPFKDGWDAVKYIAENAESEFGANPDNGFIIGGASAGGGVAAVVAGIELYGDGSGEEKELGRRITGVFVAIPLLATEEIVPQEFKSIWTSREDNKNAPGGLDTKAVQAMLDNFAFKDNDVQSPWFSPYNAIAGGKKKQQYPDPRFYLQACQYDPLRDDNIVFEKLLKKEGFETKINVFPDDPHAGWTALPFPSKSTNPTIGEATMAGMEWLLQKPE